MSMSCGGDMSRCRTWQPLAVLACVEQALASPRSLLLLHLPGARGRRVSGAMKGGSCSRSGYFCRSRAAGQIAPAPSCIAGTVLLIVDWQKCRTGLEASSWWRRSLWLSVSSSEATVKERGETHKKVPNRTAAGSKSTFLRGQGQLSALPGIHAAR